MGSLGSSLPVQYPSFPSLLLFSFRSTYLIIYIYAIIYFGLSILWERPLSSLLVLVSAYSVLKNEDGFVSPEAYTDIEIYGQMVLKECSQEKGGDG